MTAASPAPAASTRFGRALERRVETELGLCAVCAVGPVDPVWPGPGANRPIMPVRFGSSGDPSSYLQTGSVWHWQPIRLRAVLWCINQEAARTVVARLEHVAPEGERISPRWYDLSDTDVETLIRFAATAADVEIFGETERQQRLHAAMQVAIRRLKKGRTTR